MESLKAVLSLTDDSCVWRAHTNITHLAKVQQNEKEKSKKQTNQKTPPKNNSVTYFVLQAGVSVQCKDQNKALRIKHVNVCVFVEAADKRDNGRLYI